MEVMKNKCKLCNKHLRDDIPHKMCKIKACTEKLSIEMEEYENIITKLRAEYQEKHQENVKLKGKVHELTEQIKSERRIIEKRKAGPSLDLFAEFDDDISRNQSLNKAIYVENTQNDDELINIKAEPVTNSTDETSNFSNLEQKIQNSKSPLIKKSKLSLTKSTTPLRVSNDNTNTYRKWISKDKLDDKKMQSFHRPIEDLLNNTKLLETKENNSNLRKSNRKTSNRSIFNPKKMKQSTLSQYTSNTETLEKNLLNNFDETDETYCEDLIMPSQSSKKYIRSFKIIKKE